VFFSVVDRDPLEVTTDAVFRLIRAPRSPGLRRWCAWPTALRVWRCRPALDVSGFYSYWVALEARDASPMLRGVVTRASVRRGKKGVALVRSAVASCTGSRRGQRTVRAAAKVGDRAMVEAMVLGGLRRAEVLGLRFEDVRTDERRVFVADGKGGHQRLVPMSGRFFASVAHYLEAVQAQAGYRSIGSTLILLHLADDWLAGEYQRAREAIDAQALVGAEAAL
jgi:integrase/recombinase XerD